jgi:hypothetical protein
MEKWIVIGGIWTMWVLFLVLLVRGASPTVSRALRRARSHEARSREAAQNAKPAEGPARI